MDLTGEETNHLFQVLEDWEHHLAQLDLDGLGVRDEDSPHNFNRLAHPSATTEKTKESKPTPFSLRLTFEERAQLEQDAADMSLGAYIRERLFGEDAAPRKTRNKAPVKDYEALGRVLGALGSSRLSSNLNQLAKAVNTGSLPVTPETEAELREACAAVLVMREELLMALGRGIYRDEPGCEP